ncbi:uncharacterized protein [Labrus bergylta]|uniref:uncharacterized protein isoform X1 n=1 Tax=Labrus bergylta TaxID=56723 RepID=UPI0010FB5F52|nr:uncharacterized protein LOC109997167 isoform X1 [Labrus bergylta]
MPAVIKLLRRRSLLYCPSAVVVMENSDALSVLNGAFHFKILPDGTVDKSKVICILCQTELKYHRSTTSLRYHLRAKHTSAASQVVGQPLYQSWQGRCTPVDDVRQDRLTTALAKWVATDCRPVDIVEDSGLRDVLRLASCDQLYALPSQGTVVSRIQDLYDTEKNKLELMKSAVALVGDQWTPGAGSGDDQEKELEVKDEKEQHGPLPVVSTSFSLTEPCQNSDQEMGVSLNRKRRATTETTETNSAEALASLKDEDELFLLSLLPSLKRLTIKKRMEVRMKFQQILYSAEFED